jgi:GH24 family phage-related lysozyme (muramidase)
VDGSPTDISDEAINLIVAAEVGSQSEYERIYHKPTWPQGASGVTIGIGYDCGYATRSQLAQDWSGVIGGDLIGKLQDRACGVTGAPASSRAKELAAVDVSYQNAMTVFKKTDIPRWVGIVRRALPNTNMLNKHCLGALVSLAYNRGASFGKAGDRYREMNNIKAHMAAKEFAKIPAEFRSMARLWPNMRGLRIRRENEAQLFEKGL